MVSVLLLGLLVSGYVIRDDDFNEDRFDIPLKVRNITSYKFNYNYI